MFNTISWQGYWITLALLTTAYYLIIYLLYFRRTTKAWFIQPFLKQREEDIAFVPSSFPPPAPSLQVSPTLFNEEIADEFSYPPKDSEEYVVYCCMDEVNAFFAAAKRTKWVKQDLIRALQNILYKYPSLKTSEYKESINNVLFTECEHHCSIHLSAEEMAGIWKG